MKAIFLSLDNLLRDLNISFGLVLLDNIHLSFLFYYNYLLSIKDLYGYDFTY